MTDQSKPTFSDGAMRAERIADGLNHLRDYDQAAEEIREDPKKILYTLHIWAKMAPPQGTYARVLVAIHDVVRDLLSTVETGDLALAEENRKLREALIAAINTVIVRESSPPTSICVSCNAIGYGDREIVHDKSCWVLIAETALSTPTEPKR